MFLENAQLILASGSAGRRSMLEAAGLKFEVIPAEIDESKIQISLRKENFSPEAITARLAREKSLSVSVLNNDAYVIGSDQTLVLDGEIFTKAKTVSEAREKLKILRGKTHILNSAVCVTVAGEVVFENMQCAKLKMKDFDDEFLESYLVAAGDSVTKCVGAYAIEGVGAWLFDTIEGDNFTVVGMPMLPLLDFLQTQGFKL